MQQRLRHVSDLRLAENPTPEISSAIGRPLAAIAAAHSALLLNLCQDGLRQGAESVGGVRPH